MTTPFIVKLAGVGLVAVGLLVGFVSGLVMGWRAREPQHKRF
jgi:preprotein translocase subunit Sss1